MATSAISIEDVVYSGLEEVLMSADHPTQEPPPPTPWYAAPSLRGFNDVWVKPSELQQRFDTQLCSDERETSLELLESMSKLVAYTFIPNNNRQICPDILDIRNTKLLVMDRFPEVEGGPATHIGLSLFDITVNAKGHTKFGGAFNCKLFKDLYQRPYPGANHLCLDSDNTVIFHHALALDHAMECAAKNIINTRKMFSPPQLLLALPDDLDIHENVFKVELHNRLCKLFDPGSFPLDSLLSPGGVVLSIKAQDNGMKVIEVERDDENGKHFLKVPMWLATPDYVKVNAHVERGLALADLPRQTFVSLQQLMSTYSVASINWLREQALQDAVEYLEIPTQHRNFETGAIDTDIKLYRCIPAQYMLGQVSRSSRCFVDLRSRMGRELPTIEDMTKAYSNAPGEVRIDIIQLQHRPTFKDLHYDFTRKDSLGGGWSADLICAPSGTWANAALAQTCYRGV